MDSHINYLSKYFIQTKFFFCYWQLQLNNATNGLPCSLKKNAMPIFRNFRGHLVHLRQWLQSPNFW